MIVKKLYRFVDKVAQNKFTLPVALVALILSICLLAAVWPSSSKPKTASTSETVSFTEDIPSEEPISGSYSVSDGEPLSIEIASVGIKGFIQKVGIDQHQAVAAPNNVNLAGWFTESVLPGSKGLSIIDGHLSGRSANGVFKNLPKVSAGDEIIITMGGGEQFTYQAFDSKTVPNEQAASVLFEQSPTVTAQLNLITCTGKFDKNTNTYADRVIVYAKLL